MIARSVALAAFVATAALASAGPPCRATLLFPGASQQGVNPQALTFDWEYNTSGGCPAAVEYRLYLSLDVQPGDADLFATTTETQFTPAADALQFNATYWYRVDVVTAGGTVLPGLPRVFLTKPSNDPLLFHYYWETADLVTPGQKIVTIEVVGPENPSGPLAGIGAYNFLADQDETILGSGTVANVPTSRGPRVRAVPPSLSNPDTSTQVRFNALYPGNDFPEPAEGMVAELRFTTTTAIDPPELPLTLGGNPATPDFVVSYGNASQPITAQFVKSTFIPAPRAVRLVSPADASTEVALNTAFTWRRAGFNRSWDLYVWPAGEARPGTPSATVTTPNLTQPSVTPAAPLLPNTDYQWQVVSKNATGTTDSAIFTFRSLTVATPTPSPTPSPSPTETETPTPTVSPSPSDSPSPSPSPSDSPTPSASPTASLTASPSPSPSDSPTPSLTPTASLTPSPSPEFSETPSATPTDSPTPTASPTASETPTLTASATPSPSLTPAPTVSPSASATPSATPAPTTTGATPTPTLATPLPTATPSGTAATPTASPTDLPTSSASATPSASPTASPAPPSPLEVARYIVRLTNPPGFPGDVNGDGAVDAADTIR